MKAALFATLVALTVCRASAETQVVNGVTYECTDGLCRMVAPPASAKPPVVGGEGAAETCGARRPANVCDAPRVAPASPPTRLLQGLSDEASLVRFIAGDTFSSDPLRDKSGWLLVLLVVLGGLALNLTPCVLPMMPVTLMVIGRSARRGAAYGAGLAVAYGALGVAAAVGGLAFGEIQSHPAFNLFVCAVFVALGLALCGVWRLDFTAWRPRLKDPQTAASRGVLMPFAFGALAALLAGACVAPILVSVLVLTAGLYAQGQTLALGLPFALGLGMALPWPFAGAGLRVLPKPGRWMVWVNRAFAFVVFAFASWYAHLAFVAAHPVRTASPADSAVDLAQFVDALASVPRPVFVEFGASWCKNCAAQERLLARPAVTEALRRFRVLHVRAEDLRALRALPGYADVQGLPLCAVYAATPQ